MLKIKGLAALLALASLGAACSGGDDTGPLANLGSSTTAPSTNGGTGVENSGNVDMNVEVDEKISPLRPTERDKAPVAEDADTVMVAAAIDVGSFWEDNYKKLYGKELPPLEGGFWSYGPGTPVSELPPCGNGIAYSDIAVNAFYCPTGDLIAWDREGLVEPFIDRFGAFTAAVVMAHEYGHAIQNRSGDNALPQVITELQADCFAGAWVGHVVEGGSEVFEATIADIDVAVAGMIEIRDAPGSSPDDPSAHGSGFDRVSAFSDGLFEGVTRCADYGETPPVVTEEAFTTEQDAASGGNLTPDQLLPLLYEDLEDFYAQLFTTDGRTWKAIDDVVFYDPDTDTVTCGDIKLTPDEAYKQVFYCVGENVVEMDGAYLLPELDKLGDFALAAQLARQWAFAAQVQMGNVENTVGTSLHADCLTGLYAGDVYFNLRPDTAQLQLSPGDLDEAIISFIEYGTPGDDSDTGTVFQRSDAFRTGFLGDVSDCDGYLTQK